MNTTAAKTSVLPSGAGIIVDRWGETSYPDALTRLHALVHRRIEGRVADTLVLTEHTPVVTLGRRTGHGDLRTPEPFLAARGIAVCRTDRGGMATFHAPGQFIAYPVLLLRDRDIGVFVQKLLLAAADTLKHLGLTTEVRKGQPGLWRNSRKIASIGVSVRQWVTGHGIAVNVDPDMTPFEWIVPCGAPGTEMTSVARELNASVDMEAFRSAFIASFRNRFGYAGTRRRKETPRAPIPDIRTMKNKAPPPRPLLAELSPAPARRHLLNQRQRGGGRPRTHGTRPEWLKGPSASVSAAETVSKVLEQSNLHTVCASARCPNRLDCFRRGTATFMILGNRCTRGCRFCAIRKGKPVPPDPEEPERIVRAVMKLGLGHAVITSVTRDDLPDGGAAHFVRTAGALRAHCPDVTVELLIPDFKGDDDACRSVIASCPDMLNHNVETVPSLYPIARPEADYRRSLKILRRAAAGRLRVKSGIMLGMGETKGELRRVLLDLLDAGCRYITMGQYLAPGPNYLPVARYVSPAEFDGWRREAVGMGFVAVAAAPLARSSYRAEEMMATSNA